MASANLWLNTLLLIGLTMSSVSLGCKPSFYAEVYNEFGVTVERKLKDYREIDRLTINSGNEDEEETVETGKVIEFPIKIYGKKFTKFENFLFEYHTAEKGFEIPNEKGEKILRISYYIVSYFAKKTWTILDYVRVPILKYGKHFEFFPIKEAIRNVFKQGNKIRIQYFVIEGKCVEREYNLETEPSNKQGPLKWVWEEALTKECGDYRRIIHEHLKDERVPLRQEGCTPGNNPGVYYFTSPYGPNVFEKEPHHQPEATSDKDLIYEYGTCKVEVRERELPVFCIAVHYKKVLIDYAVVKSKDEIPSGSFKRKGYDYKDAIFLQGMKNIEDDEFQLEIIYLMDDCSCEQRIYQVIRDKMNPNNLIAGFTTTKGVDCPKPQ